LLGVCGVADVVILINRPILAFHLWAKLIGHHHDGRSCWQCSLLPDAPPYVQVGFW
jgi:hypothetical protein